MIEDNLFKKYKEDFVEVDHVLKGQMARLFSFPEDDLLFLPQHSKGFKNILEKSKKTAIVNFLKEGNKYNLKLYSCDGRPLILDTTCDTSYLIIRSIDIK